MSTSSLRHLSITQTVDGDSVCFDLNRILQAPSLEFFEITGLRYEVRQEGKSHVPNILRVDYEMVSSLSALEEEKIRKTIEETAGKLGFMKQIRFELRLRQSHSEYYDVDIHSFEIFRKSELISDSDCSNSSVSSLTLPGALNTFVDRFGRLQIESDCYKALSL